MCETTLGLVQGSPLSPILFIIYVEDLLQELQPNNPTIWKTRNNKVTAYADDILLHVETPEDLQQLLNVCARWAHRKGMIWQPSKCSVLWLPDERSAELGVSFTINGEHIPKRQEILYLGVTLTHKGIAERRKKQRIK